MKALGATRGRAATLAASAQSAYRTGRSFDASAIRMSNVQQLPLFCNRRKAIGKRTSSYYARTSLDGLLPDAFDQRRPVSAARLCGEQTFRSRHKRFASNGHRRLEPVPPRDRAPDRGCLQRSHASVRSEAGQVASGRLRPG